MLYVTGSTGHSGSWFIERMEREAAKAGGIPLPFAGVRCAVRPGSDASRLEASPLGIEIARGDLDDADFLLRSMRGARAVLHIASIFNSPNVAEAALRSGVEWLVMVHTTGRYSKYKSASEEYIKIEEAILAMRDRIGVTVLRPTMIYGSSRDRNMWKLVDFLHRHTFFPLFGAGANLMQPVHARDLGNAYYDVLANREKTFNRDYNLPGKRPISYLDLVRCVSRTLAQCRADGEGSPDGLSKGRNVIVKVPLSLSILGAKLYNAVSRNPVISVEQVLRMQEDKAFDFSDAERDFGYAPLSFEEGIVEEVREYMKKR
jgi:nucleoside-diphosphate-sugar epimerase